MKVLVCVRRVVDYHVKLHVKSDGTGGTPAACRSTEANAMPGAHEAWRAGRAATGAS